MMRVLIVLALVMGALGAVAAATRPAVSDQVQVKPPGVAEGNGSIFASIGL